MINQILRLVEYDVERTYGGSVRTRQLAELIARFGHPLIDHNIAKLGSVNRWRNYARGLEALIRHRAPIPCKPRNVWLLGSRAIGYKEFFAQNQEARLCLWETAFEPLGPILARQNRLPVVALPHNLECFVPWQTDQYPAGPITRHLARDLELFSRCDAVFTISREEQWLLNVCGCPAEYLPYYPEKSREEWLLEIRRQRAESKQSICLVVGSASYPPTYQGMVDLVTALGRFSLHGIQFVFAGYGTERLASLGVSGNFQFLGSVTDERLRELMIASKTALVYQKAHPGALTRIPELVLAGIPVLANDAACRSCIGFDGLYSFRELSELEMLIHAEYKVPETPQRPVAAEKKFLETLTRITKKGK